MKANSARIRSGVIAAVLVLVVSMALPVALTGATHSPSSILAGAALPSAAAAPAAASTPAAPVHPAGADQGPHPGILDTYEVAPGGATSEDPAVAYDTVSFEPILNVDEELITFNGNSNTSYVPVLATCVPGTAQCTTDYGSSLIDNQTGGPYTGAAGQEPIYWTFVIDPLAQFYDPATGKHWGVYPTDVMFSEAREAAWSTLIGVGSTAGWLTAQTLLPNGNSSWDGGTHAPYNTTPGNILGSMFINDTAFCPAVAMTNAHGCITFNASGGASDWPFFLQLVDDGFAGAVLPCGWYTAQGAGIPGWAGSKAAAGDGPCAVPQLGGPKATTSPAWQSYLTNLSSNAAVAGNVTSWDNYEQEIFNYPAPNPNVQWNMVGSGPYYAHLSPGGNPPGYQLAANPNYAQPVGCSGAGGLATYAGVCYPKVGGYIGTVNVQYQGSDTVGINEYRAGQADFATILPPETATMLQLASEGKLNYYIAPTLSTFFLPLNLNWSAAVYTSDSLPGTPNIPHGFFSQEAARAFMAQSYPYNQAESSAWTIDGVKYLYEAGGPIAKGMGNFYPTNVSFPTGNPDTNPSDVGGAAWWWAQGTNPASPYYDPSLHACLATTCVFPIVGENGDPGLDTSISEWITQIESISSGHLMPYTFDLNFGGPGSLIGDQLVQAPGTGPLPVWNLGWAADNFDPQDYALPMEFPNSTYTLSDAVEEQMTGTQFDNTVSCGHSTVTSFANLIYWAQQGQLTSACQGVAWNVANWWDIAATHVANLTQRELDYNLVVHILNAESLYIWYGQSNQVQTAAPWIDNSSINFNPAIGGGGDQFWFNIRYQPFSSAVTFTESGLPAATPWSVSFDKQTQSSATGSIVFNNIVNGSYPYTVAFEHGYSVTPANGSLAVAGATSKAVAFSALVGATYAVTFNETGLISNTTWSIVLQNVGTLTANVSTVSADLPAGAYNYSASVVTAGLITIFSPTPANGTVTVVADAIYTTIAYTSHIGAVYDVTFASSGLPAGSAWSVTLSTPTLPKFTLSSTGPTIQFGEQAGTFTGVYVGPAGFVAPISTSEVIVSGNSTVVVVFEPTFTVKFTETGIPVGQSWTVFFAGANQTLATALIQFAAPNGTWAYGIVAPAGYVSTPSGGSVVVKGATKTVAIAFAASATPSSPSSSYLSPLAKEILIALAVLAVIGFLVAGVMAARRPPASPPPKGWSSDKGSSSTDANPKDEAEFDSDTDSKS
ncbi:MAG: hypothetical protein WBG19_00740 [Thermoplasmata archaeon]